MEMFAYSIYDNKALTYSAPMYHPADGAAVRMLADLVNSADNQVGRHPKDFSLFKVGSFETNTGVFSPYYPLVHVADASAHISHSPGRPFLFDRGSLEKAPDEALAVENH